MAWLASCAVPDMEPTSWVRSRCAVRPCHLAPRLLLFGSGSAEPERLAVARQNGELLHEEGGALVGYMARQHLPSLPPSLQLLSLRQTLPPSFWYLLGAKER